jgi:hypothetical protein
MAVQKPRLLFAWSVLTEGTVEKNEQGLGEIAEPDLS